MESPAVRPPLKRPGRPTIGDDQPSDTQAPGAAEEMEQHGGISGAGDGGAGGSGNVPDQTITLMVNGEARPCPAGLMLPQLLEALGYRPQLVVVEFNGEILPRQHWPQQAVGESDVLEVVTIVGGGS